MLSHYKRGSATIMQIIGWGLTLSVAVFGASFKMISATDAKASDLGEKVSGMEATQIADDKRLTRIENKIDILIERK